MYPIAVRVNAGRGRFVLTPYGLQCSFDNKKNTTLLIKWIIIIYDIIQFEIQLPYVVAVDELPVLNVVVTIFLVVGVVAVTSVIQLDIELTYYL